MVTLKRYIGRIRKPFGWRGVGRAMRYVVMPAVVAIGIMVAIRTWVVTQYAVTAAHSQYGLMAGDRVLAVRTAYAFGRGPARGDVVLYASPEDATRTLVGCVTAVPGDTILSPRPGNLLEDMYRVGDDVVYRTLILGRVACVTYSIDPEAPFYRCLRPGRFFHGVTAQR